MIQSTTVIHPQYVSALINNLLKIDEFYFSNDLRVRTAIAIESTYVPQDTLDNLFQPLPPPDEPPANSPSNPSQH